MSLHHFISILKQSIYHTYCSLNYKLKYKKLFAILIRKSLNVQTKRITNELFMRIRFVIIYIMLLLFANETFAATDIDLSGSWNYCFIKSEKDYPPPETVTWDKVYLPNRNLFEIIADKRNLTRGYILYRKNVKINSDSSERLVFEAGEIMNTDAVFINGRQIGSTGVFPPDFRSGWSKVRNYPIPAGLLVPGENTIDIVDYFDAELWVISPIRIIDEQKGNYDYMIRNFIQIDFIHAFYFVLLTFALFFISIFLKRKKEVMYFYYACATFFLAHMTILQFIENLYTNLPLSSNTIYKICGIGPMFFPPFLALFFRSYQGVRVTRKKLAVFLLLPSITALLMWFSQDRYDIIHYRNLALLLIPLYIADIVITSIRQLVAGNKKGLVLFLALLPICTLGMYDVLVFSLHIFEGSAPLYPIGVPFMMILIGLQLINRFVYNLNTSEHLNTILIEKMEESKRLERLENEISIARKIQLGNVNNTIPGLDMFRIGVKYIPAENISGDFYNFHTTEPDKLGVLIADVSGHGIPASLIASMVKILFSILTPIYSRPDLFIKELNRYLFDKMGGNFLTAGYCYISKSKNSAVFARAGHEPLLHISYKSGEAVLHEYEPPGRIIGINPESNPEQVEFEIVTGDRIILYTDGLIEIFNEKKEISGKEMLKSLLLQSKDLDTEKAIEFVFNSLSEWNSYKQFEDDFTLIIIDID